jgi:hypothetical protein
MKLLQVLLLKNPKVCLTINDVSHCQCRYRVAQNRVICACLREGEIYGEREGERKREEREIQREDIKERQTGPMALILREQRGRNVQHAKYTCLVQFTSFNVILTALYVLCSLEEE